MRNHAEDKSRRHDIPGNRTSGEKERQYSTLIEIKMMSDERWQQLAAEKAIKHFREWYGREPETLQEAFEGQKAYLEDLGRRNVPSGTLN